jgi:AcrR family transcriptional regulator
MSRLTVPYHHGDLPAALLAAVEGAVADGGVSGVSLRDVARRAGVSHSAPACHFGSKAGLLTAFATAGYQLLAESVIKEVAAADAGDGAAELAAIGRGYVRFAVGHPAHFEVMFRLDALDPSNAGFIAASEAAYGLLTATVERCRAGGPCTGVLPTWSRSARGRWCTASPRCGSAGAWRSASPSGIRSDWQQRCQTCSPRLSCRRPSARAIDVMSDRD